jgi:hypothetical protein
MSAPVFARGGGGDMGSGMNQNAAEHINSNMGSGDSASGNQ